MEQNKRNAYLCTSLILLLSCCVSNDEHWNIVSKTPVPVGPIVLGIWQCDKGIEAKAIINTDYAGLYYWNGEGEVTWECRTEPYWWTYLPRRTR